MEITDVYINFRIFFLKCICLLHIATSPRKVLHTLDSSVGSSYMTYMENVLVKVDSKQLKKERIYLALDFYIIVHYGS